MSAHCTESLSRGPAAGGQLWPLCRTQSAHHRQGVRALIHGSHGATLSAACCRLPRALARSRRCCWTRAPWWAALCRLTHTRALPWRRWTTPRRQSSSPSAGCTCCSTCCRAQVCPHAGQLADQLANAAPVCGGPQERQPCTQVRRAAWRPWGRTSQWPCRLQACKSLPAGSLQAHAGACWPPVAAALEHT